MLVQTLFLYNCRFILKPFLTKIASLSLQSGHYPSLFKASFIFLTLKSLDSSLVSNHHPILKLLIWFVAVPTNPHAIILSLVKNTILQSLECNAQTNIYYTNFTKTFYNIDHEILFKKLQLFDFSGSLLSWLRCFFLIVG